MTTELPSIISTAGSEPFAYFDELRAADPVHWDEGMRAWVVTDFELAKDVMRRDKKDFRHPFADMMTEAMIAIEGGPRARNFQHGETHLRMHRWILSEFHPRRVDAWRSTMIRPVADHLLSRFAHRGSADLMRDLADPLPVRVMAAVMGLPWQDDDWINECKHLMDAKLEYLQHQGQDEDPGLAARTIEAMRKFDDLLRPYVQERRNSAEDDFISRTWRDGTTMIEDWAERDTLGMVTGMFFAGSDTTMHTLANAFVLLLTDGKLAHDVRTGGDQAIERFAEEALRLHGAVQFRLRKANHDTEIGGVVIAKDETVLNLHAAANRDSSQFACPHQAKLDREQPRRPQDHLAFSFGPRSCAGAALARAEVQETVKAVLEWFPDLRLAAHEAPIGDYEGFALRSYSKVDVEFTPVVRPAIAPTTEERVVDVQ
ncbi:cytochrome P450 [Nocardioides pyridinolyticus]